MEQLFLVPIPPESNLPIITVGEKIVILGRGSTTEVYHAQLSREALRVCVDASGLMMVVTAVKRSTMCRYQRPNDKEARVIGDNAPTTLYVSDFLFLVYPHYKYVVASVGDLKKICGKVRHNLSAVLENVYDRDSVLIPEEKEEKEERENKRPRVSDATTISGWASPTADAPPMSPAASLTFTVTDRDRGACEPTGEMLDVVNALIRPRSKDGFSSIGVVSQDTPDSTDKDAAVEFDVSRRISSFIPKAQYKNNNAPPVKREELPYVEPYIEESQVIKYDHGALPTLELREF